MNMPGFTAEVSIYTTANRYSGSVAGITETGSGAAFVLSTSQHGLDDSDTIGSHGYDIHSRGEAFIQGSWPTSAVWQNPNLWGVCDDTHCDGSFSIRTEWPVCRIEKNVNICEPKIGFTTVTVKGVYDRAGWDVREGFMNDLFAH